MAKASEIFAEDPNAKPADDAEFQAGKGAVDADLQRIVGEVMPQVDLAIAKLEAGIQAAAGLVALGNQLLPMFQQAAQAKVAAAAAAASAAPALGALQGLKVALAKLCPT